ncbi:DUF6197 family protein [Streptomyces chartreusis]|uniref:DUF6197 family protein n=1 Tax=Streptomyces chartreusis TaxID=1969 RepID=UPI00380AC32B
MPAASTLAPEAPRTFWSETALAAAVEAVFAEVLAEELAAAFSDDTSAEPAADEAAPGIVLPDTETLIREAGIVTGPCPPDPHVATRSEQLVRTVGTFAGRAAWLLLKYSTLFAAGVVIVSVRVLWDLFGPSGAPQLESPETVRALKAADFLEATSETIRDRGWTQGTFVAPSGAVCTEGAQRELLRSGVASRRTAAAANTHLRSVIGRRSIPGWNDNHLRTEEQVHQALLTAAERARAAAR